MVTRRDFVKALAVVGGGALLISLDRLEWLESVEQLPKGSSLRSLSFQEPSVGELYGGFLLLPDGAPVPPIVKYPARGIPIVCGAGVGRGGPNPTAVSKELDTATDLANEVDFPVYTLEERAKELRPSGAKLIKYETGEIFAAAVDFQSYSKQAARWETTASIWAQPDFPRPFPLWASDPVEPGGPAVVLEKMDVLPSLGIMVATRRGYVFHWIRQDILYALVAEPASSYQEALALVSSLALVEKP